MEIHKANPFMIDDTPVSSVNPFAAPCASVNPFLDMATASTTNAGGALGNPFLDGSLDVTPTSNSPQQTATRAYNPFADFTMDEAPNPMVTPPLASTNNNIDGLAWLSSGGAMQHQQVISPYDFTDASEVLDDLMSDDLPPPPPPDILTIPQIDELASSSDTSPIPPEAPTISPVRVIPPRPPSRPSPPHQTQQLILEVTGAMQATSDHLLDRLRAAAPSPIPGHHHAHGSHSPSPSPSPCPSPTHDIDLMHSIVEETPRSRPLSPARPVPPRPPRPAAPISAPSTANPANLANSDSKATESGFASIFGGNSPQEATASLDDFAQILDLPEPQAKGTRGDVPPAEDIDLLGLPKPRTRTKDDILRLFEKKEEKDLLAGDDIFSGDFLVDLSNQGPAPVLAPATGIGAASAANGGDNLTNLEPILFEAADAEPTIGPATDDVNGTVESPPVHVSIVNSASSPISIPERKKTPTDDEFDAFSSRFENVGRDDCLIVETDPFDPFSAAGSAKESSVWGTGTATPASLTGCESSSFTGFGNNDGFDSFLALTEPPPPPHGTPRLKQLSHDSDEEEPEFALNIKPRDEEEFSKPPVTIAPALAPPPKTAFVTSPVPSSLNPFLEPEDIPIANPPYEPYVPPQRSQVPRSDSQETPPTPLFDEDQTVPLEVFPRIDYQGQVWEMQLRQPNKKKITSQRFWKKVFVKLGRQGDVPVIQLYNTREDKDPFQELQLQPCYSVSDISAQQFDHYGKIFTVKVQYIFYKERPGIRPGQVTKAERLTSRLQQFAAYAIQGDYQGVKEFGSDLRKLGIPVEHAPHISELLKLGTQNYEELKQFSTAVEESLFRLAAPRDRVQSYRTDEVQMTAVDEFYVEQDKMGRVLRQIARVRIFLLAFLSGMPDVELGINDLPRQGKEVVGRHDIIPVITEEWIRLEDVEFHSCVDQNEFENTRTVRFKPPDACYIELLRFRVRPPKNRELPLQVRTAFSVSGNKIELRSDVLVPGYISRKYGQIPCEDVAIRFPIPESWIYMFRVEKHFRYGSVKSAHRRTGKIKGIERFLGTVETLEPTLIEVSSGSAKYEHQHRAIVWRMPRLPKEGQGSYTTHTFVCRINLASYDQMPESLASHCFVEFTMPATNVSHTTLRSLAVSTGEPPEKYVRYLARHEYVVEIEHTSGPGPAAYVAATTIEKPPVLAESPAEQPNESDSDSD